ncbi:MAG: glycosyltransferase [Oculatellaceae cyanobacterium Prado106]|jgi:glycosyltransferase involved in cell wall biosynthesis|nr:glycosyltransferase [Oculatellaceae cyanobacterium Prado106]
MKILHLNLSDYAASGGTGIAAYRLHAGLKRAGHQSKMLCLIKETSDPDVYYWDRSAATKGIERAFTVVEKQLGFRDNARILTTMNLKNHPLFEEADVVTMHCIHEQLMSYIGLPNLGDKPLVFYTHDMWSFTGQCHYSYECDRWKTGCGSCPHLGNLKHDNTRLEWKLKNWAYHHCNLHVATTSTWMHDMVQQSMLNHLPIRRIPSGLDTQIYRPYDAKTCRDILGLPQDKKILMFGSIGLKELRKGGDLLVAALKALPESVRSEVALITMGKDELLLEEFDIPSFNFGFVTDDRVKAMMFSAADLFIFPTRADNLPLILEESMACGTPLISFKVGGVPDLVRPGVTGYLAEPENVEDLRDGIVKLLQDDELRQSISRQCREIAVKEYSLERFSQDFLDFYQQAIASTPQVEQKRPAIPML